MMSAANLTRSPSARIMIMDEAERVAALQDEAARLSPVMAEPAIFRAGPHYIGEKSAAKMQILSQNFSPIIGVM